MMGMICRRSFHVPIPPRAGLLQLVLHRAYLNQRFPHMAESILPLVELAERQVRLERMAMDYFAHFDSPISLVGERKI